MSLSLAQAMAGTPAMQQIFDADGGVAALLQVEAALARANAASGIIPSAAADEISACCARGGVDPATLAADGALAGTIVIPLVAWLKQQVPDHAASVHRGGTSQDVIDTALVLQLRDGLQLLDADLKAMATAAADLTLRYATTPMIARTLMQPALPSSFGLKVGYWLAMINDARLSLRAAADRALMLQCGGAAGTMDGFGHDAAAFAATFAAELSLRVPVLPWQTRRGPMVRLGCAIAAATGAFGKIAADVILMMQAEVAELREPAAPGRGASSAMAHKRNPTLSIQVKAAALRTPHLAAMLLSATAQEHERAAGAWQAEACVWPELMLAAGGAAAALREILTGLEVDGAAMARNLATITTAAPPSSIAQMIDHVRADHRRIERHCDNAVRPVRVAPSEPVS